MENITNSTEYDNYLREHITSYCVTEFKGRGAYDKTHFLTIEEANRYIKIINEIHPNSQVLLYGLSKPPHTTETVSIAMEG